MVENLWHKGKNALEAFGLIGNVNLRRFPPAQSVNVIWLIEGPDSRH